MDLGEGRLQLVVMVIENGAIGYEAAAAGSRARRSGRQDVRDAFDSHPIPRTRWNSAISFRQRPLIKRAAVQIGQWFSMNSHATVSGSLRISAM